MCLGGLHASVEDITSLQSVKKILMQWHEEGNTDSFFYVISLFGDDDGGRPPPPVNPPLTISRGFSSRSCSLFSLQSETAQLDVEWN